jgi:hypothetical protein
LEILGKVEPLARNLIVLVYTGDEFKMFTTGEVIVEGWHIRHKEKTREILPSRYKQRGSEKANLTIARSQLSGKTAK